MSTLHDQRIDKSKISVTTLGADDSRDDWQQQSPQARLAGLEILRQQWNDYDPSTARLSRIYTVIKRA